MTDKATAAIVSRQTPKGLIEIGLDDYGQLRARCDGKTIPLSIAGIETVEGLLSKPYSRATGEHLQKIGYTHLLGSKVGLYADEAEGLAAAVRDAAETNPHMLRRRRESLTDEINDLGAAVHDDHIASIELAAATGVHRKPADRSAKIAQARAALAEFDAAHPEIAAAAGRERDEALERNRWS